VFTSWKVGFLEHLQRAIDLICIAHCFWNKILMCGLVIFCGIGKTVLPKSIHPCTSLNSFSKHKWVSWHLLSHTLELSVVRPAIFLCDAQQSGKAGRKSHVKASANLEHQVQQVLQNYLHYTRSLPFADAEHISLYSPCYFLTEVSIQSQCTRSYKQSTWKISSYWKKKPRAVLTHIT